MRVLLVLPMVPQADAKSAIPKLLHAELIGLRERCELTVVTSIGEDVGEAEAAGELERSGLDVHFVDRRRSNSALRRWRVRLRMAARWARGSWPWRTVWYAPPEIQTVLDRLAATGSFDVVAIEDSAMSAYRFPTGIPTVFTEHEAFRAPLEPWRAAPLPERPLRLLRELDWRRWERFARAAWERFDLIQVFSGSDAAKIAELAPSIAPRIRVNPFGTVLPAAPDPGRQEPDMLLFVGNFSHPPNRDAAIWLTREIMPEILRMHPSARLRIVGSSLPSEVANLAGPAVEVVADAPSVEPHMDAAAVVIAPVRTGGGMRMKVLEALARGKALVTTQRGAEGFLGFGDEPPFLVAGNATEMAVASAALLSDPRRRRELGHRAREFAQRHHSQTAWAARLEAVYREAQAGDGADLPKTAPGSPSSTDPP